MSYLQQYQQGPTVAPYMSAGQQYFRFTWDPRPRKIWLLGPKFPFICIPGMTGAGKSVTVEIAGEEYKRKGYQLIEAWSSGDLENLYYCVPDLVKVFSWRRVPGTQENKFRKYLKERFGISWIDQAKIEKSEDNKKITITYDKFVLELVLIRKNNRVEMRFNGTVAWVFNVRKLTKDGESILLVQDLNPDRIDWQRIRRVGYAVLIIKPDATEIKLDHELCRCGYPIEDHDTSGEIPCPYDKPDQLIKFVSDNEQIEKIVNQAMSEDRILIFNKGLYYEHQYAYIKEAQLLHELPYLRIQKKIPNKNIALLVRELSTLVPQAEKAYRGEFELMTKREIINGIREYRHFGITFVVDYQRNQDIRKPVAAQRHIMIFKRSTPDLLPEDFQALYWEIETRRKMAMQVGDFATLRQLPSMSMLKDYQAYVLFHDNHYRLEQFPLPTFHHKQTGDDWGALVGATIKFNPSPKVSKKQQKAAKAQAAVDQEKTHEQNLLQIQHLRDQNVKWKAMSFRKFGYPSLSAMKADYYRARDAGFFEKKTGPGPQVSQDPAGKSDQQERQTTLGSGPADFSN